MASKKSAKKNKRPVRTKTALKIGDTVMVIAGGHKEKRPNKGKVGKIISFAGEKRDRVVVEGVNYVTKHKRATSPQDSSGKIQVPAPIHISNVMYYAEKIAKPVRLTFGELSDGKKVRGYMDPEKKEFVQLVE